MPNNSGKPSSIGKKKGGFLFASASDRSLGIVDDLQKEPDLHSFNQEAKANNLDKTKSMSLSGTLKDRLSQYKALKEEEQRNNTLAATPQIDIESEKEKSDESWVPKVEPDSENIATNGTKEVYEEEEVIETEEIEQELEEGSFAEEDTDTDSDDDSSFEEEEVDMESSHTNDESEHGVFQVLDASHKTRGDIDQDVFRALDEAERAEIILDNRRSGGLPDARNNDAGNNEIYNTVLPPSNRELTNRSSENTAPPVSSAPPVVSSQGQMNDKTANSGSSEKSKMSRGKLNWIIFGVITIACIAIVAIILPFFLDYGSIEAKNDPNSAPAPVPAPVPTPLPITLTSVPPTPPTGAEIGGTESNSSLPSTSQTDTPTSTPTSLQWGQFMKTFAIPISGEEILQDKSSPQYRAAKYILEDPYTSQLTTTEQLDDRYASVTFYFATEGENWNSCYLGDRNCTNGQWLVEDTCDWFAVSCNDDGRVTSFRFANAEGNGLFGTLPLEMYLLSDLTDLVIINNTITGTLPQAFGDNATQLRSLLLPDNELTGTIPDNYLESCPLEFVHLGSNLFTGQIPTNIGNTTYLQQFDLSGNSLTGSIPDKVSGYESLEAISFANNKLTGSIPDEIYSSLARLRFLHLNGNKLSGTVSSLIGELQLLKELRIGQSDLGGALPDELYTLTNLEELDISQSRFKGRLSLGLINLGALEKLFLNDNKLDGTVPASFGSMSTLSDLVLQGNKISGSIPDSICLLREDNLKVLTVDCNKLACDCCSFCF